MGNGSGRGHSGFAGVALMIWWAIRRQRADLTIVLAWLALQSIVIFTPEVKFLRYQIPIVPVLAIASRAATGPIPHLVNCSS